jgi:hypothetical protein
VYHIAAKLRFVGIVDKNADRVEPHQDGDESGQREPERARTGAVASQATALSLPTSNATPRPMTAQNAPAKMDVRPLIERRPSRLRVPVRPGALRSRCRGSA